MSDRKKLSVTKVSHEDIVETLRLYNALPSKDIVEIKNDDYDDAEIVGEAIGVVPDFYGTSMMQEINEEITSGCDWLAIMWGDGNGKLYRHLLGVADEPESRYEILSAQVACKLPTITKIENG